jgi:hypothetical protein
VIGDFYSLMDSLPECHIKPETVAASLPGNRTTANAPTPPDNDTAVLVNLVDLHDGGSNHECVAPNRWVCPARRGYPTALGPLGVVRAGSQSIGGDHFVTNAYHAGYAFGERSESLAFSIGADQAP